MLKHYFRVGINNIAHNAGLTLSAVVGLSCGVCAFLFLVLVAEHELSFETAHPYADQTYRVLLSVDRGDGASIDTKTPDAVASQLRASFPEIDYALRAGLSGQSILVEAGGNKFYENRILGADTTFFDVFAFEAIEGNLQHALRRPDAVVFTESTARKYFGDASPIGETVNFEQIESRTVTAVIRDPKETHFDFDILTSLAPPREAPWNQRHRSAFVVLNTDAAKLQDKLAAFVERHQIDGSGIAPEYSLQLQPIKEIYLDPGGDGNQTMGRLLYVYGFGIAGILVLLIAGFNYANTATARMLGRLREMGVRRVWGAERSQIAGQILIETVLISIISTLLGVLLLGALIPWAGPLSGFDFTIDQLLSVRWLGIVLLCAIVIGLLGGALPASTIPSLSPVNCLRGWTYSRNALSKKLFVAIQLTVSAFFVIISLIVLKQIQYAQEKRLNQVDGKIVVVSNNGMFIDDNYDAFKERLLSHPAIEGVTTGSVPGQIEHRMTLTAEEMPESEHVEIATLMAGEDYLETLGLSLIDGQSFSEEDRSISDIKVIYNETAARRLNLFEKVGDRITGGQKLLLGVVEDFHMSPLYDEIEPMEIWYFPDLRNNILVRFNPLLIQAGMEHLRQTWQVFVPERPVLYEFLDDRLDHAYAADIRVSKLFGAFAGTAVLLAIFGMYSFVGWSGSSRKKEISVRKVCGAGRGSIIKLLISGIVKVFVPSFVIGAVLAWVIAIHWLQDFAYRLEMPVVLIIVLGIGGLLVSITVVGHEAFKAASMAPTHGLR